MRMRSIAAAAALLALAFVLPALSAGDEAAPITVKGEILDLACYLGHGAMGADHAGCAKSCVKGGQPMGLLADDGTVYVLFANHQNGDAYAAAKDLAGQKVELKGVASEQGGVHGLEVAAVKAL